MNTSNEGKEFVSPIKLKETGFNSLNRLHALKIFFVTEKKYWSGESWMSFFHFTMRFMLPSAILVQSQEKGQTL